MKKILLPCMIALVYTNLFAKASLDDKAYLIKEYKEMFKKISQKRIGLDESQISQVSPPFVMIVKKSKESAKAKNKGNTPKAVALHLEAILGKSVMINGKWYKLYQNIGNFKIISVTADSVYLKGEGVKQKLTIRKKNANITIK